MAQSLLLNIIGILGFIVLLYIGMRLSKDKIKSAKSAGYFLIVISILGLLLDLYNLMHNYIL